MDFSKEMFDEILRVFQVESEEIISRLNNSLLDLEKNPHNKDAILNFFRDAHTLKGAARMVGFNNIQNLAHKMEDLLGKAKDNELSITSDLIEILYNTVDFLADIIPKSIDKKKEIFNENFSKQLITLENAIKSPEIIQNEPSETISSEEITVNIKNINSLISEILFLIMQLQIDKTQKNSTPLKAAFSKLEKIFKQSNHPQLTNALDGLDIIQTLNKDEIPDDAQIDSAHKNLDSIITKLISISELYGLEVVDYYELAFSQISQAEISAQQTYEIIDEEITSELQTISLINKPEINAKNIEEMIETPLPEDSEICSVGDLNCVKEQLSQLAEHPDYSYQIKSFLINFNGSCQNEIIKKILEKIIAIFAFAEMNETQLDEEVLNVILQSVEICDNILKGKSEAADSELILQRLAIVEQILELGAPKSNQTTPFNKSEIKEKAIPDVSDVFNTGEIKTLRVDSTKLDQFVNQVNELTITKIKAKKHLHEIDILSKQFEDWQRTSAKALNYLKYYDKKYFQSDIQNPQLNFFIKQLLNLFVENNKKIQTTASKVNSLYRTIQEDDAKTGLIVDNLDHMIKNIRVLPLATVFHLFGRMVRDIAKEKNKDIELEIFGSETSTDKKIIEEIKMPLIHMIRNSIDHGIESPEKRIELGKNPVGKIILSAKQANNKVIIEIQDDGSGLNIEKIRQKAVSKGYLTKDEAENMNDEQITNIIFAPGFSTGDEVTSISGRGIGLDVVATKISQLGGKVRVISEVNKGCCVQIELPITMSTVKVFIVKTAGQLFAIPMEVVNTVLRKNSDEIISNKGAKSIILNNKTVPFYKLSDILNLPKTSEIHSRETILVLQSDGKNIALGVEKLIEDQEILYKKLSAPFYKLKNISGITTLPSGEICLILNISDIVTSACGLKISGKISKQIGQIKEHKILLVDDSITTRTLEKNILTKAGYQVEIAQNPVEALELMQRMHFNLIISDIEMPEMSGLEFLQRIKADEMFHDIPVIMLSSLVNEENKRQALELGAKKCILKNDFNQEEFKEAVSEILRLDA